MNQHRTPIISSRSALSIHKNGAELHEIPVHFFTTTITAN